MPVTRKSIESRLQTLNMILERPLTHFASKEGEPIRFAVGHIGLCHSSYGYSIEEVTSTHGSVHVLGSGMSARDADNLIQGMLNGIALRNAHIGELLLRSKLSEAGLCKPDHPLYQDDLHSMATETVKV